MLTLDGLQLAYPGQPPLLAGLTFQARPGVLLITGDMGRGKSTLLRLLGGDTAGLLARPLPRLNGAEAGTAACAAQLLRPDAGWDSDEAQQRSPEGFAAAWAQADAGFATTLFAQHAEALALTPHLHKPLLALSTGARRKLWWCGALASSRPLALLDEPTGGLDGPALAHLQHVLPAFQAAADAGTHQRLLVLAAPYGLEALAGQVQRLDLDSAPR